MSDQTPKEGAERWNYLSEGLRAENAALTARCEALEQEKATLHDNVFKHLGIALSDDGDEAFLDGSGIAPLQDVFVLPAAIDHHGKELRELRVRCEALTAERDTLRQKLSDTDETRVSFAAGYTAALDDALKGKP